MCTPTVTECVVIVDDKGYVAVDEVDIASAFPKTEIENVFPGHQRDGIDLASQLAPALQPASRLGCLECQNAMPETVVDPHDEHRAVHRRRQVQGHPHRQLAAHRDATRGPAIGIHHVCAAYMFIA